MLHAAGEGAAEGQGGAGCRRLGCRGKGVTGPRTKQGCVLRLPCLLWSPRHHHCGQTTAQSQRAAAHTARPSPVTALAARGQVPWTLAGTPVLPHGGRFGVQHGTVQSPEALWRRGDGQPPDGV